MKQRYLYIAILLLGGILIFGWVEEGTWSPPQEETRAAIDIGSGSTNLKIAKINPKTNKIISILFETNIRVPYQKYLEQSSDMTFNKEIMAEGTAALKNMKQMADSYHVRKVVAVATAAFRQARNAPAFVEKLRSLTGIDVRVISQEDEGILAFNAALATQNIPRDKAIVWDIGGGSLQMVTLDSAHHYLVAKGTTASIPFKNELISKIEGKDPKVVSSPNPIDAVVMQEGLDHARAAAREIAPYIKEKIQKNDTTVLGVGTLFHLGIRFLLNEATATPQELEHALASLQGRTDEQLKEFNIPEVAVSNPLLVLGFMKELNIKEVSILDINNADGALTYAPFWQEEPK